VPGLFRVARNPEPDSTLPYLLWVPVGDRPLVLKAKDTWPRNRQLAQEWAYRFLGAAAAYSDEERLAL
jgi:hypothetical protein